MPRPDHAALKATSRGHCTARHDMCELTSAVSWRHVANLPRFGFFRLPRRNSRRLLTRMLLSFGVCLTVVMTIETAGYTEYELTLKFKPVFLLLLCYVSIVHSFLTVCEQRRFKVFEFRNARSKISEKCLPVIFQMSKHILKFSFLFFAQKTLCIQYIRFTTFFLPKECKVHMQLSHALHN
jgi:hypothetical protein